MFHCRSDIVTQILVLSGQIIAIYKWSYGINIIILYAPCLYCLRQSDTPLVKSANSFSDVQRLFVYIKIDLETEIV